MRKLNLKWEQCSRIVFIVISLLFFTTTAYTQPNEKVLKLLQKADLLFYEKDYEEALKIYLKSFKKDDKNSYCSEKIAYSYLYLNQVDEALKWFQKTERIYGSFVPDFAVRYALALMESGKYEQARDKFQEYNDFFESDNKLVYKYLLSIENKDKYYDDSTYFDLMNTILSSKQANFSPQYYNGNLFYVNSAMDDVGEAPTYRKTNFMTAKLADDEISDNNDVKGNNYYNNKILSLSIAEDVDEIYGTYVTGSENPMRIYGLVKGKIVNDSELSKMERVNVVNFNLNILHVTVNDEGKRIIFASDAPGGYGGYDLYSADKINGKFQNVTNLGPIINSAEDDIFPYLLNDSIMYFASKGHGGLGGFDIFYVHLNNAKHEPENMGFPVNTNSDDFTLSFYSDYVGFISSNRPAGKGLEDIYRFEIDNIKYKSIITDEETGENLRQLDVKVDFSDGKKEELALADNGTLVFDITPGDEFEISVNKTGYEERTFHVDSKEWSFTGGTTYDGGKLQLKSEVPQEPIAMLEDNTEAIPGGYVQVIEEGVSDKSNSNSEDTSKELVKEEETEETQVEIRKEPIVEETPIPEEKEEVVETETAELETKTEVIEKPLVEKEPETKSASKKSTYHYENVNHGIDFLVQIGASKKTVSEKILRNKYKGDLPIDNIFYKGWYIYYIAKFSSYYDAKVVVKESGVHDAFVSAFKDNSRLRLMDAIKLAHVPSEDNLENLSKKTSDAIMKDVIYFNFDDVTLTDRDMKLIYGFVDSLKANPAYYLELIGYSDKKGSVVYNKAISYQRAVNIQQMFLVEGIEQKRLETYGYGEGDTSSEHKNPRRVEIIMRKR